MLTNLEFKPARYEDADAIVKAIRSGFSEEMLARTIYGAEGIADFVRLQLSLPPNLSNVHYTVAQRGHEIVGCVEIRRETSTLFLNYISVLPDYRGTGLGKGLIRSALSSLVSENLQSMLLDVFEYNQDVRTWYERLGFKHVSSAQWWSLPPRHVPLKASAVVSGFPQAEATHKQFGFSQVNVRTPLDDYAVGRLGDRFFRLTKADALNDQNCLGALTELDPHRSLLVIDGPQYAEALGVLGGRTVTLTHRLSADIQTIRTRLQN